MSVILNALKKSEYERQAGRAPSGPAPAPSPPPATTPWPWLGAAGAALGIAAVVAVVVGAVPWRPASPPIPAATEANAALHSDDPGPPAARAAIQRKPARPAWPVPMAALAKHPRQPHHGAAPGPTAVAAREAAQETAEAVHAVSALAVPPQQSPPTMAPSPSRRAATPNMAAAPAIPVAIEPMAIEPIAIKPVAEAPRRLAALDRPVGPGDAARPVPPAPLVEAAAPPPRPPPRPKPRPRNVVDPYATVPMLAALPRAFVSSVPQLALSLHVYDKEPGNRLVRLNGKTYREGDVTADGMTLDAIVPNGLVLRYEGRQFRVRM